MIKRIIGLIAVAALFLPLLLSGEAQADSLSSRWVINQYTKSRLFVGDYDKDRKILHLGWQVSLKEGWKTYWRSPGEAGLPPRWAWQDTKNIHAITVHWPAPKPMNFFDMNTYVYYHEVILPIEIEVMDETEAAAIALDLDYMICAEICVPLAGHYSLDISAPQNIKPSLFQKAQLDRFRDRVPVKISGSGTVIRLDQDGGKTLHINFPKDINPVKEIIVEGPESILFGRPETAGKNQFTLLYSGEESLTGQELTLTLLLKDGGARELKATVQP